MLAIGTGGGTRRHASVSFAGRATANTFPEALRPASARSAGVAGSGQHRAPCARRIDLVTCILMGQAASSTPRPGRRASAVRGPARQRVALPKAARRRGPALAAVPARRTGPGSRIYGHPARAVCLGARVLYRSRRRSIAGRGFLPTGVPRGSRRYRGPAAPRALAAAGGPLLRRATRPHHRR